MDVIHKWTRRHMAMKSPVVGVLTARGRSWSAAGAGVLKNPNKDVCPGPNPLLTPPTTGFLKPPALPKRTVPVDDPGVRYEEP